MTVPPPTFDYPSEAGRGCVFLEEGTFRAILDRNAAMVFALDLHWLATEAVEGEEINLLSWHCAELPYEGQEIGYCEFNLTPGHLHKKQGKTILKTPQTLRHKPHGSYDAENDRLDYFVSAAESLAAYKSLVALLEEPEDWRRFGEVTLFDTLIVRLIFR